jgi:glycosyltransferase involved in cell wall biosynthesis
MISTFTKPNTETALKKPLRICIVSVGSPKNVGGLASYMRFLSQDLSKSCDVSVVSRFTRHDPSDDMYSGFQEPEIVENGGYKIHVISSRPLWRPLLRRLRSLVSRPPLQKAAIWIYGKAYQKALSAAIPQQVDVVHLVGVGWELLGFLALAEAKKRGAAFTVLPAVHPGTWGDSTLDVKFYNEASAVLVLSESEREHLAQRGVEPERLQVCGLAPATEAVGDAARFRRKHELGGRPLILFVGRKDRGKGYHALREAMPVILADVPEACLVAVGPDREPPYPAVPETAMLDLGFATEEEKADALAACDVFCLPSENESFGIVYVEAWSYGKPVVGGSAPAVRSLITDGVNGYCVAQDQEEIAGVLLRLLRDPALRRELGENGRQLQQSRYAWDAVTEFHQKVFRQAISANTAG